MECHSTGSYNDKYFHDKTYCEPVLSRNFSLPWLPFYLQEKAEKCSSRRLLLETCKQLNETHVYKGQLSLYISLPSVVDLFFFAFYFSCSSYLKLLLLVVLLSIHKYALKYRVFARDNDKLDSLSWDHSFT